MGTSRPLTKLKETFTKETKKALELGEEFAVEFIEEGLYQSVFPHTMAEHSQLHVTAWEGWEYIAEVILANRLPR